MVASARIMPRARGARRTRIRTPLWGGVRAWHNRAGGTSRRGRGGRRRSAAAPGFGAARDALQGASRPSLGQAPRVKPKAEAGWGQFGPAQESCVARGRWFRGQANSRREFSQPNRAARVQGRARACARGGDKRRQTGRRARPPADVGLRGAKGACRRGGSICVSGLDRSRPELRHPETGCGRCTRHIHSIGGSCKVLPAQVPGQRQQRDCNTGPHGQAGLVPRRGGCVTGVGRRQGRSGRLSAALPPRAGRDLGTVAADAASGWGRARGARGVAGGPDGCVCAYCWGGSGGRVGGSRQKDGTLQGVTRLIIDRRWRRGRSQEASGGGRGPGPGLSERPTVLQQRRFRRRAARQGAARAGRSPTTAGAQPSAEQCYFLWL